MLALLASLAATAAHGREADYRAARGELLSRISKGYSRTLIRGVKKALPRADRISITSSGEGDFSQHEAHGVDGARMTWQVVYGHQGAAWGTAPSGRNRATRAFATGIGDGMMTASFAKDWDQAHLHHEGRTLQLGHQYLANPVDVTETADVAEIAPGKFVVRYRIQSPGGKGVQPIDEQRILGLELVSREEVGRPYHALTLRQLWYQPRQDQFSEHWGRGERLYQAILATSRKHVLSRQILPAYKGNYIVDVQSELPRALGLSYGETISLYRQMDRIEKLPADQQQAETDKLLEGLRQRGLPTR